MRLKVRAVNCRHKNYNWQITLNKTFKLQLDESGRGKTLLALFSGSVPISQKKREPSKDKMNTRTWPETGTRSEAQRQTSSRRPALSPQTGRESHWKVGIIILRGIKMSQKYKSIVTVNRKRVPLKGHHHHHLRQHCQRRFCTRHQNVTTRKLLPSKGRESSPTQRCFINHDWWNIWRGPPLLLIFNSWFVCFSFCLIFIRFFSFCLIFILFV